MNQSRNQEANFGPHPPRYLWPSRLRISWPTWPTVLWVALALAVLFFGLLMGLMFMILVTPADQVPDLMESFPVPPGFFGLAFIGLSAASTGLAAFAFTKMKAREYALQQHIGGGITELVRLSFHNTPRM